MKFNFLSFLQKLSFSCYFTLNHNVGRNINNIRYADDSTLMTDSKEELKPLDKGEKAGLKLNIQKTKIMASSLIISGK